MKTVIQAFTGGFDALPDCSDLATKLVLAGDKYNAEMVIVGWNTNVSYCDIVAKLHERNKEVFLWLPGFSEYGNDATPALDYSGVRHNNAVSKADDDFTFACPAKSDNIELTTRYYDKYFSGYGFDGVFLDKIRFSSFGNGFRSGIGCFCHDCLDFYANEVLDTRMLVKLMESSKKDFLVPCAIHNMRYVFENPLINSFYSARAKLITESVRRVIASFRERGLKIGLDVFAPPFAYWVGQDIEALAGFTDFIKPMIYRVTDAPAGMPYEQKHMATELLLNGCDIGRILEALWDTDDLTNDECFRNQLRLLEKLPCQIFSGVEINKSDFCATDTFYVENSIKAIKESHIAGYVLSWNVLADNCITPISI